MFTSILTQPKEKSEPLQNHQGLDLSVFQCKKLQKSPIYSNYAPNQLHYVIDAVQKGRKPPTKIGIKRLFKKKSVRGISKTAKKLVAELNPKSPEEVCLKALRTEFRNELEKSHMHAEPKKKEKSVTMIRRKLNQRKRRNELIKLVKRYKSQLLPHFRQRLSGFGRCPKVSRQEIKDYLKTLGIRVPDVESLLIKNPVGQNGVVSQFISVKRRSIQQKGSQLIEKQNIKIEASKLLQQSVAPRLKDSDFPSLL